MHPDCTQSRSYTLSCSTAVVFEDFQDFWIFVTRSTFLPSFDHHPWNKKTHFSERLVGHTILNLWISLRLRACHVMGDNDVGAAKCYTPNFRMMLHAKFHTNCPTAPGLQEPPGCGVHCSWQLQLKDTMACNIMAPSSINLESV